MVRGADPGKSHSVSWSTAHLHSWMEDLSSTSFVLIHLQFQTYSPPSHLHPPTQDTRLFPQHQYLPPLPKQNRPSSYHFDLLIDLPIVLRMEVCLVCWNSGGVVLVLGGFDSWEALHRLIIFFLLPVHRNSFTRHVRPAHKSPADLHNQLRGPRKE